MYWKIFKLAIEYKSYAFTNERTSFELKWKKRFNGFITTFRYGQNNTT